MKFYDSHGGLWESCESNDPGAQAFGPTGIAREIEGPSFASAKEDGYVLEIDGWPVIDEERWQAIEDPEAYYHCD